MVYTPLATSAQFQATAYAGLVVDYQPADVDTLMIRASRSVEALCRRRLTPFTGLTENHRATGVDVEDATDFNVPLDPTAQLGVSRAQSLGATGLVRHLWVNEVPPLWPDQWVGAITGITVIRSFSGSQTLDITTISYEPDHGHVRFRLGTFIPPGSTLKVTYSGGYNPVPEDLVEASLIAAARMALIRMLPQARPEVSAAELKDELDLLTEPYWREH